MEERGEFRLPGPAFALELPGEDALAGPRSVGQTRRA